MSKIQPRFKPIETEEPIQWTFDGQDWVTYDEQGTPWVFDGSKWITKYDYENFDNAESESQVLEKPAHDQIIAGKAAASWIFSKIDQQLSSLKPLKKSGRFEQNVYRLGDLLECE